MRTLDSEFADGWRILLGSILGITAGVSSLYFYSAGLFIKPLAETFGWSRGEASLGPLIGSLGVALAAAPTGWIMDRVGPLKVAVFAMAALAGAFLLLAVATQDLATYLALTAMLAILATGSSSLVFTRFIVGTFNKRRGLALGITLTGTGIGGALIPAFLNSYIAENGWKAGYIVLSIVAAIFLPVIWLLLRAHKATPITQISGGIYNWPQLFSDPVFRRIAVMFFLAALGVIGILFHFVPMLTDEGLSPSEAGATASVIGLAIIFGRVISGHLLDRLPARYVVIGLFVASSLGMIALAAGGADIALPGALIIGLAVGAEVDILAFLTARHFNISIYGAAFGALYALYLGGSALAPAIAGYLYDFAGNYTLALLVSAACMLAAAAVAWRLPEKPTGN